MKNTLVELKAEKNKSMYYAFLNLISQLLLCTCKSYAINPTSFQDGNRCSVQFDDDSICIYDHPFRNSFLVFHLILMHTAFQKNSREKRNVDLAMLE